MKVTEGIDTADVQYYTVRMAMGKRERARQPALWMAVTDLPTAASHPFYHRLNQLLAAHGFDDFVEEQCAPFYAKTMGRPSVAPGICCRLLFIGYFEGLDSERGIAWLQTSIRRPLENADLYHGLLVEICCSAVVMSPR